MPKKKTHEEFIQELQNIQPNIIILGKYVNSATKIKCKCLVCDNIWETKPSHLLGGHGCPKCNKTPKKSHETFIKEMSAKNNNIEIIGRYIDSKTKILCKCKFDNHEWYARPDHLLSGNGCPKCASTKTKTRFQKTNKEFIEELKEINPNVQLLEEYANSRKKVLCKCLIDNYEWKARPDQLLQGHACPKCSGRAKKEHDTFVKEIRNINPNITILGEYKNSQTKLKCKCIIDGYEWDVKPNALLNGHGCPMCAGNIKKTHKEFIEQMNIINPNIEILNEYKNTNTKIHCRCKIDGYEWKTTVSSLLRGSKCKKCLGVETKTKDEFYGIMNSLHPNIKITGRYVNHQSKLDCECLLDGHKWSTTAHTLMRGHGCKRCAGNMKKTHEEFVAEASEKNKNLTVIGKYQGTREKILCKCNKCGNEWFTSPSFVLYGCGCPNCATTSKGELKISELLDRNNIDYISQKTFEKCSYRSLLRFDFFVPSQNLCIEYQGEQHYEPVDFAGKGIEWAKMKFEENQEKDNIKRIFCKDNNINLLEIPYWDYENIEEILSRELGLIA